MANKTRMYTVQWCWKEDGNRANTDSMEVRATTVPRAISKVVSELNADQPEGEKLKASELLVVDVRTKEFN